jgi:hypothetical protein
MKDNKEEELGESVPVTGVAGESERLYINEWGPYYCITSISCRVTRGEAQALCPREKPFLSRSGAV